MNRLPAWIVLLGIVAAPAAPEGLAGRVQAITVDYPADGTVFPPDMTAPLFRWRDSADAADAWLVEVVFTDGAAPMRLKSRGERMRTGEIDPRCVADTNRPPELTPQEAAGRTWRPDPDAWAAIKRHSTGRDATVTVTGIVDGRPEQALSRGQVTIRTSEDPVGAPIFYRDVPLMPSELQKGVIKPLAPRAVPLIAWRLRYVGEPQSRLMMEGLPTCANCHSFSRDGKTLGMDLDGPQNDKSLYTISAIGPRMSIRTEDIIQWNFYRDPGVPRNRIGFMSQVSPDGRYIATTVNGAEYVANFKDYRFLQVFYQTRGVLAWYSRDSGRMETLPGADDPSYAHTNAVWSPDGKYLVFGRAKAREPYPEGRKMAAFAGDPNETPIQYDLYRIPFNEGRGGRPEPIRGASRNGMSNSFPKFSPDGRFIVFVQARNGLLMRPDSQLYIIPAEGGKARRLRSNTPRMNSWHSFSPNGRWLVFSSKGRSPYTQMYLTHLDEDGNDSPAILIENATAANRAVNIPEFLNVAPGGLEKIDVPAAEFYGLFDLAWELGQKGQYREAIAVWQKALKLNSQDARAHNNLASALSRERNFAEAIAHYRKALQLNPDYGEVYANLGRALAATRQLDEAVVHLERAVNLNPSDVEARVDLARALAERGRYDEAIRHYRAALDARPGYADGHNALGVALARKGKLDEAIASWNKAIAMDANLIEAHYNLGNTLHYLRGKGGEALAHWRAVLALQPNHLPVLAQSAWVLATSPDAGLRNGAEAVQMAARAVQLSGGREPALLDILAAGYAEAGRFAEAVKTARQAQALAVERNDESLAQAVKIRVAMYEDGKAFRDVRLGLRK